MVVLLRCSVFHHHHHCHHLSVGVFSDTMVEVGCSQLWVSESVLEDQTDGRTKLMEDQTDGGQKWCWLDLCATASSTRLITFCVWCWSIYIQNVLPCTLSLKGLNRINSVIIYSPGHHMWGILSLLHSVMTQIKPHFTTRALLGHDIWYRQ